MSEISLETVTGKLNRLGYDAFIQSLRQAKKAGNRNVELAHWLYHILENDRSDASATFKTLNFSSSRCCEMQCRTSPRR